MAAECICPIPDSFNVRIRDLRNPRCPVHGVPMVNSDKATAEELGLLLEESIQEVQFPGRGLGGERIVMVLPLSGKSQIISNLLARYDIRRKRG